mmetsp:Transcript_131378/g.227464  ORF Transcript_131378/g.227464 Transcript_131378/m.227464 type:complete len:224 (-) Transcript_131378:558-1229(-)
MSSWYSRRGRRSSTGGGWTALKNSGSEGPGPRAGADGAGFVWGQATHAPGGEGGITGAGAASSRDRVWYFTATASSDSCWQSSARAWAWAAVSVDRCMTSWVSRRRSRESKTCRREWAMCWCRAAWAWASVNSSAARACICFASRSEVANSSTRSASPSWDSRRTASFITRNARNASTSPISPHHATCSSAMTIRRKSWSSSGSNSCPRAGPTCRISRATARQ